MNISDLSPGSYSVNSSITQPSSSGTSAYSNFLNSIHSGNSNSATQGVMSKFGTALKTPGANNPLNTGTDPRLQGLPSQNTSGNIGSTLKDMGTTAANDTLKYGAVMPATRIAQAGVQTYNEFQNPGYDTGADTGNPQRPNAGGTATPLPVNAPKPGVNTSNSETNINKPQTNLGQTIEPQQQGTAGAKQIGEQALGSAGAIGNVALAENPIEAVKGAAGAFKSVLGDIATKTGITELPGMVDDFVSSLNDKIASKIPEATPEVPKAPENSRINDATPSYKSVLKNGDITSQISDENGNKINRVDEGKGFTGARKVNPTASETANGAELNNIKDYPDKGSFLEKSQATRKAISTEAQSYKAGLAAEDKSAPLVSGAKDQVYKNVFDNLSGEARDAFLGKENKLLSQAGQPIETAKSIVGRYGQDIAEATSKYDGSRLGLQQLKEDFETAYQNARGNSAYGSEQRNGIDQMNSSLRDYLKSELSSSTKNTDVLASLDKQSKLYRANDVLQNKAEAEAVSHYGRFVQAHPAARMATRILSRQGIMIPLRILESAAGLAAVYAATKKLTK